MSKWKTTADIAIIGGGIMGCSTAYHLAKRGQKDVVLLERDLLAQASTGLSVGGIRLQFSHHANIRLSLEALRLFEHFEEEFNVDIGFNQVGYLFMAQKKDTWEDFLDSVQLQRQLNVPVEVLSPEEIKHRWPYLEVNDIQGGTFGPKDGYADPYNVAMAFANKARKTGVRIEEKTKVTGIRVEESRVKGIETTKGPISTPIVINVAGPWGGEVARMAGLEFPVKPYRRQVFMTKAFKDIPKPVPMIIDFDALYYLRGEGPGILTGMSDPDEPPSFNTNVDWNFLEKVIEKAVHRAPILEKAKILKGWGGLYTITPDENPIIEAIPQVEGFFCAIGFSGHGFQHGPAVGRILSELILDGHTDFDLIPFVHNRFDVIKEKGEKRAV
ncbi:MAG: FAD-binding oxidoreductase [Candidatus Aminicenantes bacterium]|nr:MAG: FAD-binding oxidoreductase [Candidatus Aminicenantes bacterium]